MFVDKKLTGLKAVQTLSRLNRTYPGKEDTFILDFVNDPEDIRKSFEPYYEDTVLEGDIDPNELYSIQQELENYMILREEEMDKFVAIIYKEKPTKRDTELSNSYIDSAIQRYLDLSEESNEILLVKQENLIAFTCLFYKLRLSKILSYINCLYIYVIS